MDTGADSAGHVLQHELRHRLLTWTVDLDKGESMDMKLDWNTGGSMSLRVYFSMDLDIGMGMSIGVYSTWAWNLTWA